MMLKISSFSTYLSKSTKQLESLKEQVKLLAATKKQYTDQQNQNAQTNNFDYLVDLLRIECREVEAFQETLKQKEFIDNLKASTSQKLKDQSSELAKLQAGKTTLKSIFSKGSSTEQAQIQEKKYQKLRINLIHQTQNEIKLLDELCMMISSILCLDEIDRFKKNKQNKYYESLIKVSQLGQQLNELYIKFWSEVSKGTKAEVVV